MARIIIYSNTIWQNILHIAFKNMTNVNESMWQCFSCGKWYILIYGWCKYKLSNHYIEFFHFKFLAIQYNGLW